jgi:hypothetical protein
MMKEMKKPANADELVKLVRELPLEERENVVAQLTRDFEEHFEEDPAVRDEVMRRAKRALEHPEDCIPAEQFIAELEEFVRARKR